MKAHLPAFLLSLAACGGAVATSSAPPEDRDASVPENPRPGDASTPNRDASEPVAIFPGPATEPACTKDTDCDEPNGAGLGTCWKSENGATSCLCKKGSFKQPSGRCATTTPPKTCAGQGGRCTSWPSCSNANANAAPNRPTSTCTGEDVCCVSACKPTAIKSCYVQGSDQAYVPVCIAGWVTCQSGDSPDLDLP